MNHGNSTVEEFWITLRNVCTGTMVYRTKRNSEADPRPDIFRYSYHII